MDLSAARGRRHRLKERVLCVSFDADLGEGEIAESCRIGGNYFRDNGRAAGQMCVELSQDGMMCDGLEIDIQAR